MNTSFLVSNFDDKINQFDIHHESKKIFQSYRSTIFILEDHTLRVGHHFDYSRTTSKYAKKWLKENTYASVDTLWKQLKKQQDYSSQAENKVIECE